MSERPEELGLKVLYEGNAPVCDIVAVHGLGATPEWAWVSKDRSGPDPRINWLKDHRMLPHQVPDSRIMTFNYESKGLHPQAVKAKLSDCANSLLNALKNDREEVELCVRRQQKYLLITTARLRPGNIGRWYLLGIALVD